MRKMKVEVNPNYCTLAVPKFILPNFGNFYQYVNWHHILKLHKLKVLGQQKVAFGGSWSKKRRGS